MEKNVGESAQDHEDEAKKLIISYHKNKRVSGMVVHVDVGGAVRGWGGGPWGSN
jgi:hypothetical protein